MVLEDMDSTSLSLLDQKHAQDKGDQHEGQHDLVSERLVSEEAVDNDEDYKGTDDSVKSNDHLSSLVAPDQKRKKRKKSANMTKKSP
jgi:hypothetical protein